MTHQDLFELPPGRFEALLREVEEAFAVNNAAYFYDNTLGFTTIDYFRQPDGGEDDEAWFTAREFASSLDQLLIFAFESAPDSIVKKWGKEHGQKTSERAVEMVKSVQELMPNARSEWDNRRADFGRILGDAQISVAFSPEHADFRAILRMNSFDPTGLRKVPTASSRQYFDVVLSPAEIQRLISKLESAASLVDFMDQDGDDE